MRLMLRASAIALALAGSLAAAPAVAETIPGPATQEALIKTALLSLNDANVTGNYAVLHAKLSKQFRNLHGPDALKAAFKPFHDEGVDFDIIAAFKPVASEEPRIDDRGALLLRGYFDTQPTRVLYQLAFIRSEGDWKPLHLDVKLRSASE